LLEGFSIYKSQHPEEKDKLQITTSAVALVGIKITKQHQPKTLLKCEIPHTMLKQKRETP